MGLDVGKKRIGVSVSDELGWTAQGVEVIQAEPYANLLERLQTLMETYDVQKIIVGLPKNMDGSIGETGQYCRDFAEKIGKQLDIPVQLWDERLSSRAAERVLIDADVSRKKRKQMIDKMAAVMILQSFLDAQP